MAEGVVSYGLMLLTNTAHAIRENCEVCALDLPDSLVLLLCRRVLSSKMSSLFGKGGVAT